MADYSDSITAGGTSQKAATNRADRQTLVVQNLSDEELWLKFGATAVADEGFRILPDESQTYRRNFLNDVTKEVHILGATTGQKYTMTDDTDNL